MKYPVPILIRQAGLLLLILLGSQKPCDAQWKKVFQFSDAARSIYFLDRIGHPEIGFVGLNNGELWKTSDTGITWQRMTANPDGLSITDITFKDVLTGWFVTEQSTLVQGPSSVFTTTDGGSTWSVQARDPGGQFTSVYYHQPQQLLFISNWQRGGFSSSDDGKTMNVYSAQPSLNGYAFSDKNNGIASLAGVQPFTMMQTSDGGFNWQPIIISATACWQPAAIAGTTTFFMFSEYDETLSRSDDAGATWIPVTTLTLTPGGLGGKKLSGCLRNTPCNQLFIQTTNEGFYTSTDLGVTWVAIGGPSNESDTRFWVDANEVFGTDFNGALFTLHTIPVVTTVTPQLRIVNIGKRPVLSFSVSKDIPASESLDSFFFDLKFNADMFRLDSAVTPAGWKVDTSEVQPGWYHFVFHNGSHTDIAADSNIILFYFTSYVTTDSLSSVLMSSGDVFFDPRKHSGCQQSVMSLANANDTVFLVAVDSCGDQTLRHFLQTGNIGTRIVAIRPDPASVEITIETESASAGIANVMIYDDLGRECMNLQKELSGKMSWALPISSLSAGPYHLILRTSSGSISSEFIKTH